MFGMHSPWVKNLYIVDDVLTLLDSVTPDCPNDPVGRARLAVAVSSKICYANTCYQAIPPEK